MFSFTDSGASQSPVGREWVHAAATSQSSEGREWVPATSQSPVEREWVPAGAAAATSLPMEDPSNNGKFVLIVFFGIY